MKYPDGEIITTDYNNRMLPVSLSGADNYVPSMTYDSAGRLTARTLGNSLTQTFTYYPWNQQGGRLQTLAAASLQNLTYTYDPVGNITQIADGVNNETQTYTYDALRVAPCKGDRLTSWTLNGSPQETYAYDPASGNLAVKGARTLAYTDPNHPHAVTSAGGNSYQYDANGSQTTRQIGSDTFTLYYDAENRLVEVKKNGVTLAQFIFDGDGNRVKSVLNGVTTYFVGNYYEVTGGVVTKYYYAGATRLAVRTNGTLSYLLGDHLGSSSVTTNANGVKTASALYKAFGETRYTLGNLGTDYKFTGQREEVSFGLYFYNARWYDPAIGRFAQADSIVPGGVQGYDRYAYSNNSPVVYTDPSGHRACESKDGIECDWKTPYLWDRAETILKQLGGKNDLEAMAKIIEAGARVYRDFDTLLPALSGVFIGSEKSGPDALWAARNTGCAGVGREPHDCQGAIDYFSDTGFHPDFRDGHNQLFHLWGYIANTAAPGNSLVGGWGVLEGTGANVFHEIVQSVLRYPDNGWGTSWQDYELSGQGMYIGSLITTGSITPSELANIIRNIIGSQGTGSGGEFQQMNGFFGPLSGQ